MRHVIGTTPVISVCLREQRGNQHALFCSQVKDFPTMRMCSSQLTARLELPWPRDFDFEISKGCDEILPIEVIISQ